MTDNEQKKATVKIDGQDYALDSLGDEARKQLLALQACEMEIVRLKQQLAINQTARNAYAGALKRELEAQATPAQ